MHLLQRVVLLCWLAHAAADESIGTCVNSDSSICSSEHTQRRAQNMVFANYAADNEENEQEDENDADLMMHMQTRLNVDIPKDEQAGPKPKGADQTVSGEGSKVQQELPKAKLSLAGHAAKSLSEAAPGSVTTDSAAPAGQQPSSAQLPLLQLPDRPSQAVPNGFATGNQILLGAAIGAVLVVVGALMATALSNCATRGKGLSEDEIRAAAKVLMLDWALGYDPDDKEGELIEAEVTLKSLAHGGKKQPPMATDRDSDSGDTDEEEPEAESDDHAEMLEDAVFVAEQVEVANEAMDAGYGRKYIDLDVSARRDDTIRCDLR